MESGNPQVGLPPKHPRENTPASRQLGEAAGSLWRFVYTHNPLYAASAGMVFYGLRSSFDTSAGHLSLGLLTLCLAGYTLLLALTAFLVIHVGKVWDDARSLLLLTVLMFLGISVTFDDTLANAPLLGTWYCLGGWLFAAVTSELLLHAIRLRLPWLFRLPYHLLLAAFFAYPICLAPWTALDNRLLEWRLFGFVPVLAGLFLLLLPAVRRGPSYARGAGCPWPWPGYPWAMFGLLAVCAGLRAYYLCISFHFVDYADTIFGPYFLVPLGFAAALLLLETSIVTGDRNMIRWALSLPLGMLVMASVGHSHYRVYLGFLQMFQETLGGSPLFVTLALAIAFYLVATVRRVRYADDALTAAIALLAVISPGTLRLGDASAAHAWPLALAAAWQLWLAIGGLRTFHLLAAGGALIGALAIWLQGTWFTAAHGAIPWHMLLFWLIAIGLGFDDPLAQFARRLGGTVGLALVLIVSLGPQSWFAGLNPWLVAFYPLVPTAAVMLLGWLLRDRRWFAGAATCFGIWISVHGLRGYDLLRMHVSGLNQLAWGFLFFVLAALISGTKAGFLPLRLRNHSAKAEPERHPT